MTRLARFQLVLALVALTAGVYGFVLARDLPFSEGAGAQLGWPTYEIRLMTYNRLGAIVVIALGLVGLGGALARRPLVGWVPAAGFALLGAQVLLQWRAGAENLLAASGTNLSFGLAMVLGFAVTATLSRMAPYR